jgi:Site-specific recombinases, DNA invertase Pin homologs
MSTEHQQYSPENQLDVVRQYAASHNMEIVQVYSDHGRSGLNIAGREGLNQLMSDVENKQANFSALLVYDVSRWGRFQDVDESAYYEYVLKRAGIRVHYCAEQFENDGSMSSSVLKTLLYDKSVSGKRGFAGIFRRFLVCRGRENAQKTKWRWMQSQSNCSLRLIPYIREKYREFWRFWASNSWRGVALSPCVQDIYRV